MDSRTVSDDPLTQLGEAAGRRILEQVEDRIRTLTRFPPPGMVATSASSSTAEGVLSFDYLGQFATRNADREGLNGTGVRISRNDDFDSDRAELQRFRDHRNSLLQDFAREQEGALIPIFDPIRFAATSDYAYLTSPCKACSKSGMQQCFMCHGARQVTCDQCSGSGQGPCSVCNGSAMVTEACGACGGTGSRYEYVNTTAWNSLTNQYESRAENVSTTCSTCFGSPTRHVTCRSCLHGRVSCSQCAASGRMNCRTCSGTGQVVCGVCKGLLGSHTQYTVAFEVREERRVTITRPSGDHWLLDLLDLVDADARACVADWSALPPKADDGRLELAREIAIPYASATLALGSETFEVRALGPELPICDYAAIGDTLLASELLELDHAPDMKSATTRFKALVGSDINRSALTACHAAVLPPELESAATSFAQSAWLFVSAGHVERLVKAASALVVGAFVRAHRRGVLAACLVGAVSTGVLLAVPSIGSSRPAALWIPLALTVLVGLVTELVARLKGPMGVRLARGVRASALLRRAGWRVRAWRSSYVLIGLAFAAIVVRFLPDASA